MQIKAAEFSKEESLNKHSPLGSKIKHSCLSFSSCLYTQRIENRDGKCATRHVLRHVFVFLGLTQLFFGSQCVEAGLGDDLTEQLQQHVVMGGLHVGLVVDLDAAVVVHLVPLLVNIPAT